MAALLEAVGVGLIAFSAGIFIATFAKVLLDRIRPKPVFLINVEPDDEDGGYVASCLSLPGCHSQGETVEEALANIVDAIQAYTVALAREHRQRDVTRSRQPDALIKFVGVRSSVKLA